MTSSLSGQAALTVGSTSRTSAAHRAWQARRRSRDLALASSRLYTVAVESCVGDLDMGPPCCQVTSHPMCSGAVHLGQALGAAVAVHLPATITLADHAVRPALPVLRRSHWITSPLASSVARTTSST